MIVACLVVTYFFVRFVQRAPGLQVLLVVSLWIILPLLWIGGSLLAWQNWPKRTYRLTNTALILTKREWFGNVTEELYRYETILSIKASKGFLGGNLVLTLAQLPPITIRDVLDPEVEARTIKAFIAAGQPKVQPIA